MRLSGGVNKSIVPDGINRYRVSPLKLKSDIKHKNVKAKYLQCQYLVSERSCRPSPYIFDIHLFFSSPQFKKLASKLRTIAFPVRFMVLKFDYGILLSITHVSKYCLMLVTFYPSVVILRGGG